jgi:hypothetical protein
MALVVEEMDPPENPASGRYLPTREPPGLMARLVSQHIAPPPPPPPEPRVLTVSGLLAEDRCPAASLAVT